MGTKLLSSEVYLDPMPSPIKSKNTVTNRFTGNTKKRRYVDMLGMELNESLSQTVNGKCYNKLKELEKSLDVAIGKQHNLIAKRLKNEKTHCNVTKILRLSLFNTVSMNENECKWNLKIQT